MNPNDPNDAYKIGYDEGYQEGLKDGYAQAQEEARQIMMSEFKQTPSWEGMGS